MGLFSRKKPKIQATGTKKDGFSGWVKCTHCHELIHAHELESHHSCCPKCSFHYRLPVEDRIRLLTDKESFHELFRDILPKDSLGFVDQESYAVRLEQAKEKSKRSDAVVVGEATLESIPYALGVLDFQFMGGSMGSVVGEKLTRLIEYASEKMLPLVIVATSGGARMQEGTLSLMQMAKTSAALGRHKEKGLFYISIMTNPTTGGVTASFASLGDVILSEPSALVCFAGPRVIEQILGKPLPPGAQHAESLLKNGMLDAIVPRKELRKTVHLLLSYTRNHS